MLKKILPWFIFIALAGLLVLLFVKKDDMGQYMSKIIVSQTSVEIKKSGQKAIDSLYNYAQNKQSYEMTFLGFGADNCVNCKRMKTVQKQIGEKYPNQVNIVCLNVLEPENLKLMKMFGIATIPSQVLLNKKGKEFFRNSGYYAPEKLIKIIEKQLTEAKNKKELDAK